MFTELDRYAVDLVLIVSTMAIAVKPWTTSGPFIHRLFSDNSALSLLLSLSNSGLYIFFCTIAYTIRFYFPTLDFKVESTTNAWCLLIKLKSPTWRKTVYAMIMSENFQMGGGLIGLVVEQVD